jgi:hypothetical protein
MVIDFIYFYKNWISFQCTIYNAIWMLWNFCKGKKNHHYCVLMIIHQRVKHNTSKSFFVEYIPNNPNTQITQLMLQVNFWIRYRVLANVILNRNSDFLDMVLYWSILETCHTLLHFVMYKLINDHLQMLSSSLNVSSLIYALHMLHIILWMLH